eukprot:CAMPEP_0119081812 /NCGR_PEP_ID=MMETSP1178-20130426/118519_1 /TAXON_ID=33656 /ORGANISM="unid sp, Strain CCMP2000" /LENGTH=71 /DNA_ID=CAMNT_0007064543 /DNA_START=213 /DNA_END=424 /DNA_ORIENTATION=-
MVAWIGAREHDHAHRRRQRFPVLDVFEHFQPGHAVSQIQIKQHNIQPLVLGLFVPSVNCSLAVSRTSGNRV